MKYDSILALTTPGSAAFDSVFTANLSWCMRNGTHGFADCGGACAGPSNGNNKYIGRFGGG
jgi:hypothetical protein